MSYLDVRVLHPDTKVSYLDRLHDTLVSWYHGLLSGCDTLVSNLHGLISNVNTLMLGLQTLIPGYDTLVPAHEGMSISGCGMLYETT